MLRWTAVSISSRNTASCALRSEIIEARTSKPALTQTDAASRSVAPIAIAPTMRARAFGMSIGVGPSRYSRSRNASGNLPWCRLFRFGISSTQRSLARVLHSVEKPPGRDGIAALRVGRVVLLAGGVEGSRVERREVVRLHE